MKEPLSITGKTSLVGVIGWPVEHSLSPPMHNAAFANLGLDWAYVPLMVHPSQVRRAIRGLVALNFVGANVTIPHKQEVMRYLDELSDAAKITGAVNTIHLSGNKLMGYNTDAIGFLNSLLEAGCSPEGMQAAVLGAGGAARAVVYALCRSKANAVTVFNRTAERAAFLIDDLAEVFPNVSLQFAPLTSEALHALNDSVDLVVNTTSVGMFPNTTDCPWPEDVPIPAQATFYDLVYNPLETTFLARSRAANATAVDGLGMLVHQGAYAFERWTGHPPPVDVMRQACMDGLGFL